MRCELPRVSCTSRRAATCVQAEARKREARANAPDGKPKADALGEMLAEQLDWPEVNVGCANHRALRLQRAATIHEHEGVRAHVGVHASPLSAVVPCLCLLSTHNRLKDHAWRTRSGKCLQPNLLLFVQRVRRA